jgi:predicted outer membrane repeat protein
MLTFLMRNRAAWSDFFTGNPTLIQSQTRQTPSNANAHVLNCLFKSITSTDVGGALCCTSVTCLLIESTSFFSCNTSANHGGAIYFSNTGSGQCVFHEVCGYDCFSTYNGGSGQFSYTNVRNDATSKNYINYSSVVRCLNVNSNTHYTLAQYNGKQCYTSINISNNKCGYRSGIYFCPFKNSNLFTGSFLYSTFADNIATVFACICLGTTGAKYEMKSSNILRNTQPLDNGEGTFAIYGNFMIEDSCILENKAKYIFCVGSSSYTATLSNCTVDSTSNNGYLTIQNTVTKSFILALNHMSTRNCHSEYDSAGTLTAIIQTLTPSKKHKVYYTCERLFNLHQHGSIASLASILVFNFLYPYTSGNL